MLGNPVAGHIYPKGSTNPPGTFEVTATFADHLARVPPANGGVDIGNGFCGALLLAMCSGRVSLAQTYPDGSKVIRIVDAAHPELEPAVAHCATIEVQVGQIVTRGQRIGTLGKTGASSCHVHVGLKRNGVEVDVWPFLDQNGGDMTPIPTAVFRALDNKKTSLLVGANFRSERQIDPGNVIKQYPASTAFAPSVSANDGAAAGGPTPTLWYGGFLYSDVAPQGFRFGWFHSSVLGPLVDATPDCKAEVDRATAPLTTALNAANAKITTAKNALA